MSLSARHLPFGILLLCALGAGLTVLRASSGGMGFSPDSVSYFTMAEGIASGQGLVDIRRYSTPVEPIYPPGYPVLLALGGLVAGDLMASIPWLHALLFAVSTLLVGSGLHLYSRSWLVSLAGTVFFVASGDLVMLHGKVWSEVPFLTLILLFILLLASHLEKPSWRVLTAAACCAALMVMMRYPGAAAVAGGCGVLLTRPASWRRRLGEAALFGGVGSSFLLLFLARNVAVFGRPYLGKDRGASDYAFSARNLQRGVETIEGWTGSPAGISVLCLAVVLTGLFLASWRRPDGAAGEDSRQPTRRLAPLVLAILAFILPFIALMLAGTYAYGLHKPLDSRALSPLFGPLLWLSLLSGWHLASRALPAASPRFAALGTPRLRRVGHGVGLVALLVLSGLALRDVLKSSDPERVYGILQRPPRAVVEAFKDYEAGDPVFTNIDDTLYLLTGKRCLRLPQIYHLDSRDRRVPDHDEKIERLRRQLASGGTLVYYTPSRRHYLPSEDELRDWLPLRAELETRDGTIYRVEPSVP